MERFDPARLGRYESLFIGAQGADVLLACPARVQAEVDKGRHVLVLALFEPAGWATAAVDVARTLGAAYEAAGLQPVRERRGQGTVAELAERLPADEEVAIGTARLLADVVSHTQSVHVFAPLGLGQSADHQIAYEAALRAFASEPGRNLFLYEERPDAFVPGAVRTRLALLGTRLPPGAQNAARPAGLWRHLLGTAEVRRLRGETGSLRDSLALLASVRRRFREARPWNPARAYGPRLQPVVHLADEEAMRRARAAAEVLLPHEPGGRSRAAERFNARAAAKAKKLGGVYHAERLWLFLPSSDGLPETQHPMELPAL